MLSLLSAAAMTLIVQGILVGSVLGLLYQMRKLTVRSEATEKQFVAMYCHVRDDMDTLEGRVNSLQTTLKARRYAEKISEYLHESPDVCLYNGGKWDSPC